MEKEEGLVGVDYDFDHEMSDVWMDYEKLMGGNLDLMEEILAVEVVDFEEGVSGLEDPELVGDDEDVVVDVGDDEDVVVDVVDFEEDVSGLQDPELDEDVVVDVVDWMVANIDFTADDDDLFQSWLEDDDIC